MDGQDLKMYVYFNHFFCSKQIFQDEIEPTEKLFVGKLPLSLTEAELMEHFTQFGVVTEAIVSNLQFFTYNFFQKSFQIKDQRGFGFVTFSTIQEADQALEAKTHIISDSEIEVKRAMPNRFQSQTQSQVNILLS